VTCKLAHQSMQHKKKACKIVWKNGYQLIFGYICKATRRRVQLHYDQVFFLVDYQKDDVSMTNNPLVINVILVITICNENLNWTHGLQMRVVGPRPKKWQIKTKPTWHHFEWKFNWSRPKKKKELKGELMIWRTKMQARVQGIVELKHSSCFKWVQIVWLGN
jgi:hypothetical protein